jgi:beta-galactosidase
LIERADRGREPKMVVGYSRDHDRKVGAASFVCHAGSGRVLFHRVPDFSAPLQAR